MGGQSGGGGQLGGLKFAAFGCTIGLSMCKPRRSSFTVTPMGNQVALDEPFPSGVIAPFLQPKQGLLHPLGALRTACFNEVKLGRDAIYRGLCWVRAQIRFRLNFLKRFEEPETRQRPYMVWAVDVALVIAKKAARRCHAVRLHRGGWHVCHRVRIFLRAGAWTRGGHSAGRLHSPVPRLCDRKPAPSHNDKT